MNKKVAGGERLANCDAKTKIKSLLRLPHIYVFSVADANLSLRPVDTVCSPNETFFSPNNV